jgi:hypothetical protein
MKIEINIDESEIEQIIKVTKAKRDEVKEVLEEWFHGVVEDFNDSRVDDVIEMIGVEEEEEED